MNYLLEVLKILDGAVNSDRKKVIAYAEQLATKLEEESDKRSAQSIRRAIEKGRSRDLSTARLATPSLPVDSESRLALADERLYLPNEVAIRLDQMSTGRVAEFIQYIRASDQLLASGVGISPSLLAYGPPGCGKTELAKYISAQLELPLLTARTDTLISSYLGSTAKNLRLLFEHAMARPCVLFLDEFDAVAKLRDDQHELGELKRVVVSLLQNIDALDNRTVLIAATNHEHLLDRAIWRRFAFRIHLDLPSEEVRESLLKAFLGDHAHSVDIHSLSLATAGMSGADIRQICEDSRRSAILARKTAIVDTDLLLRIARIRIANFDATSLKERLLFLRKLSPKVFNMRKLAEMFSISTGKVSMLTRNGDSE